MTLKFLYDTIDSVKGPIPNLLNIFLPMSAERGQRALLSKSTFHYMKDYIEIESSYTGSEKSNWFYPLEVELPIFHIDNLICGGTLKRSHFWNYLSPKVKEGVLSGRGKILIYFHEPVGEIFLKGLINEHETYEEMYQQDAGDIFIARVPFQKIFYISPLKIDHPNFLKIPTGYWGLYVDSTADDIDSQHNKHLLTASNKKYVCFLRNYHKTYYRFLVVDLLEKADLLDQGLISLRNCGKDFKKNYTNLLTSKKLNHFPTFTSFDKTYHSLTLEKLLEVQLNLVVESEWRYNDESSLYEVFNIPYATEKTFRNFLHKKPFIIIGQPYTLKELKKQGYKTFHPFIDESYDEIEDPIKRITTAIKQLKKFCSKEGYEIDLFNKSISNILEHNFNVYNQMISKDRIYKELIKLHERDDV